MIEKYAREFVAIGKFLFRNQETIYRTGKGSFILADRAELKEMLNRNRYDTADNKLKIWKALHWIVTEDGRRVTKRIYNTATKKYEPKVAIDVHVMEMLQELQERKNTVE